MSIDERIAELERLLGDPTDPANPVGAAEILAADERAELVAAGTRILDDFGLKAEVVPVAQGGRFGRADHLIEIMRSVYRRDPALGLGYLSGPMISAANVWTAGSLAQRRRLADLLLANGRVAAAYHELDHGNDIGAMEFAARPAGERLVLRGRKEVVANLRWADAVLFLARTDPAPGRRSHTQLYVELDEVDRGRWTYLPRYRSVGMRGVDLGGVDIDDCEVDAGAVLGRPGMGMEVAGKAFQFTRIALPAMCTGILDTGIRTALDHVRTRTLYGRGVDQIPMVRTTIANAFVDLLVCEAVAQVAARALHLLPRAGSVYAPAVKYLLSGLLLDSMRQLTLVMGAEAYRRDGPHAIFEKLARDLKPVGFGHFARAACLTSVVAQLPLLARRGWRGDDPAHPELVDVSARLAPLDFAALSISTGGQDPVAGSLNSGPERLPADTPPVLRQLVRDNSVSLRSLVDACGAIAPADLGITAGAATLDLARTYVALLAAAACTETWLRRRPAGGFLADRSWITAALVRLAAFASRRTEDFPADVEEALFAELRHRHDHGLSFGLSARAYR